LIRREDQKLVVASAVKDAEDSHSVRGYLVENEIRAVNGAPNRLAAIAIHELSGFTDRLSQRLRNSRI
jgi:hypothetical protein